MARSRKDIAVTEEPAPSGFALPVTTPPMEAVLEDALPEGETWQFEPKWDGFRCLAFRRGGEVDLRAKSGKPLARYFPEVVAALKDLDCGDFILDGELAIVTREGLSFSALQMRTLPRAASASSRWRRPPSSSCSTSLPRAKRCSPASRCASAACIWRAF